MEDEVVDVRADAEREPPAPTVLEAVVKAISDLDDLVRALAQGLSRAKPGSGSWSPGWLRSTGCFRFCA